MEFLIDQWIDTHRQNSPMRYEQPFEYGDELAHRWRVTVTTDGKPADLTGCSCQGYVHRVAQSDMVIVSGTISGNTAEIVLPAVCYAIEGQIVMIMRIAKDDAVACTAVCYAYVSRNTTDAAVDPGEEIPSLSDLLAQLDNMKTATAASTTATSAANTAAASANSAAESANSAAESANSAAESANSAAESANAAAASASAAREEIEQAVQEDADAAAASAAAAKKSAESITGLTVSAETLDPGSTATASYDKTTGLMTLGIPQGKQGEQGIQGEQGPQGVSPTVATEKKEGVAHITITDASGTHEFDIYDGEGAVLSVNGKTGTVVLTADDVSAVPTTRTVNGKALSADITLDAAAVGAISKDTINVYSLKSADGTTVRYGKECKVDADFVGAVPTTRTINDKPLSADITLGADDVSAVPTTRKINDKPLSADITLDADDVSALPDDTTYVESVNGESGAVTLADWVFGTARCGATNIASKSEGTLSVSVSVPDDVSDFKVLAVTPAGLNAQQNGYRKTVNTNVEINDGTATMSQVWVSTYGSAANFAAEFLYAYKTKTGSESTASE